MKRLGLDLGTSSLGWAILDDEKLENAPLGNNAPMPIDCGVIVFPEGLDRDKSESLTSPAANRRQRRAARRLIYRRKLRKISVLRALIDLGMCPLAKENLEKWKEGIYPIYDDAFMAWLAATDTHNPYIDRKLAAEGKVDALTLGRALYHIAQRRGFKSSRKEQMQALLETEEADASTKKKKANESEASQTKQAIDALSKAMGERTLGQYFHDCYQKGEPIRGHKTGRIEHYQKEFDVIMSHQDLSDETKKHLATLLFSQRPLKIQRHLVGWCMLEKGRAYNVRNEKGELIQGTRRKYRRCIIGHPEFERFRALAFVNNIVVSDDPTKHNTKIKKEEGRPLSLEERKFALEKLCRKTSCKVFDILPNKKWGCNYRLKDDAPHMPVRNGLIKLGLPEEQWQKAINASVSFDDLEMLRAWAIKHFHFSDEEATAFLRINPSTDRAQYSLHAIKKILPYLENGFMLKKAVFCAKLEDIIPDYATVKEDVLRGLEACEKEYQCDHSHKNASPYHKKVMPLIERYKHYLATIWNVSDEKFKMLYTDITETNGEDKKLPPVNLGTIKNPLVCRSLTVLRRLINTLRAEGKIDEFTIINLEMAHAVNSSNACRAIEKFQKEREEERTKARSELRQQLASHGLSFPITEELLLKYILWKEQGEWSVYTGQSISFKQMIEDCDIEHTIPRACGGTSERENLTLCESSYNRNIKKNKLPSECPNAEEAYGKYPPLFSGRVLKHWVEVLHGLEKALEKKPRRGSNPSAYNEMRQKYLIAQMKCRYWQRKIKAFKLTADRVNDTGFMPRQMVDTGIITSYALKYLKSRYYHVHTTNGAATAFARKSWGLQKVDEAKQRIDHTHHAIDAIVTAALDLKRFQQICIDLKNEIAYSATCTPPYPHFGELIQRAKNAILVRHLPNNRQHHPFIYKKGTSQIIGIRGSLHDDTTYGVIQHLGVPTCVSRKTIAGATVEDLKKWATQAVDPVARKALAEQVAAFENDDTIPQKQISFQTFWLRKPEGDFPGLQIKSIRIKNVKPKNPNPIRQQIFDAQKSVYVSGSDILRLEIYQTPKGKKVCKQISLLDEAKASEPQKESSDSLLYVIHPNTLALTYEKSPDELMTLTQSELSRHLYVIQKIENTGRLTLRFHTEARRSTVLSAELKAEGKNKEGASQINFVTPEPLLLISPATHLEHLLIENVHFHLTLDGKIEWINHD